MNNMGGLKVNRPRLFSHFKDKKLHFILFSFRTTERYLIYSIGFVLVSGGAAGSCAHPVVCLRVGSFQFVQSCVSGKIGLLQ